MEKIKNYPSHIARPFTAFTQADDESAMHKSLLDMGESFLTYLVGIMFGEYKRSGEISDRLESEFYKYSSRKPSFGVFLSFMRMLSTEMKNTILTDKFEKGKKYLAVSEFISEFELLKKVINDGADDEFYEKVEALRKGHTAGQKGLMDFYNIFISIRNTYAHPDDKAGPSEEWKNNNPKPPKKDKTGMDEYNVKMSSALRKWPLSDDYYSFINPLMHAALSELVEDFEILQSYKPILAKLLDDKNKKGTFLVELGAKESELELELSTDDLRFMNTDLRYLLDPNDKLFVKLYYHAIPQLNPEVAKKIIDREKAKAMEPHMLEMIHAKLIDDGKIDDMEYLVLRDTAKTSAISDERLFQLIEKVKNKLGIKDSVGTPDNLGDIFIEAKDTESNPKFNPWWLYYLAMVKNIDKKIPKEEKKLAGELNAKVSKLKKSKKTVPVLKKVKAKEQALRDLKKKKSEQIKKINERIAAKREMRKKATKPERKAALLADITVFQEKIEEKREDIDGKLAEMERLIGELKQTSDEKLIEIDSQIDAIIEKDAMIGKYRQWSIHKGLWADIGTFVNYLVDTHLNTFQEDADEDDAGREWVMEPNQWQIGALAYTYWGKIYPEASALSIGFHVGFSVSRSFKWLGSVQHPEVKEKINQPCICVWPSIDVKYASKIDPDHILLKEFKRLIRVMMNENLDILKRVGANVQCINRETGRNDTVPLDYLLEHESEFDMTAEDPSYSGLESQESFNLFSKIWIIDDFMEEGSIAHGKIAGFEKDIAVYLTLVSNVIKQLNDFALANGINRESVNNRLDQVVRLGDVMNAEFEKYVTGNKLTLTDEDDAKLMEYARSLGLDSYTYIYFKNQFVFSKNWEAKQEAET
jgi:hypothetical protein